MTKINYNKWIWGASYKYDKTKDETINGYLKQIEWIMGMGSEEEAQKVFDIWYKEMIKDSVYEKILNDEDEDNV